MDITAFNIQCSVRNNSKIALTNKCLNKVQLDSVIGALFEYSGFSKKHQKVVPHDIEDAVKISGRNILNGSEVSKQMIIHIKLIGQFLDGCNNRITFRCTITLYFLKEF